MAQFNANSVLTADEYLELMNMNVIDIRKKNTK
jgi:hypothetical protein